MFCQFFSLRCSALNSGFFEAQIGLRFEFRFAFRDDSKKEETSKTAFCACAILALTIAQCNWLWLSKVAQIALKKEAFCRLKARATFQVSIQTQTWISSRFLAKATSKATHAQSARRTFINLRALLFMQNKIRFVFFVIALRFWRSYFVLCFQSYTSKQRSKQTRESKFDSANLAAADAICACFTCFFPFAVLSNVKSQKARNKATTKRSKPKLIKQATSNAKSNKLSLATFKARFSWQNLLDASLFWPQNLHNCELATIKKRRARKKSALRAS